MRCMLLHCHVHIQRHLTYPFKWYADADLHLPSNGRRERALAGVRSPRISFDKFELKLCIFWEILLLLLLLFCLFYQMKLHRIVYLTSLILKSCVQATNFILQLHACIYAHKYDIYRALLADCCISTNSPAYAWCMASHLSLLPHIERQKEERR